MPKHLHDAFAMAHLLIQNAHLEIEFSAEGKKRIPGSVFIYRVQSPKEVEMQFDFRDDVFRLAVFLRLGNRGVIAIGDGGAVDIDIGDILRRDGKFNLHPVQFEELGALAFYKAGLLNKSPAYLMTEMENGLRIFQMPLAGLSSKPVFDPWIISDYAKVLSTFIGLPTDRLVSRDGSKVMQWRMDQDGKRLKIDLKKFPHLIQRR